MNAASLLHWLLRTSLEAGVLILIVLGLRFLLGARLSPRWRVGLWMLVGLKLLLPACIPASFGLGGWVKHVTPSLAEPVAVTPSAPVMTMANADMLGEVGVAFHEGLSEWSFEQGMMAVWIAGVLAVLGLATIRQLRFAEELKTWPHARDRGLQNLLQSLREKAGIRRPVDVILCPAGSTPAVVGIRRPHLLLPEDWRTRFDDASLSHVLLHELQHIRHYDLFWNWIALAVQALHWFNPLVWMAMSRFQTDRELRCDLSALELLPSTERLGYGHTLLRIQETFFAPPAVAGLAPCVRNHPALRQRITMIAQSTPNRPWFNLALTVAFGLISGYAFTTVHGAEDKTSSSKEGAGARSPEAEQADFKRQSEILVQRVKVLLPDEIKINQMSVGENVVDIDGEAPTLVSVLQFRTQVFEDPKLQRWTWESPHPYYDSTGRAIFRFCARASDQVNERSKAGDETLPGDEDRSKKPGTGDRGVVKTGPRDGDAPKTGPRDGEKKNTGPRDGENKKTGMRDGDRPKTGERDTGRPSKEEALKTTPAAGEIIVIQVTDRGRNVTIDKDEMPLNRLRGYLQGFLPEHPSAQVVISGKAHVPEKALFEVMDAVRDNGHKNVRIAEE